MSQPPPDIAFPSIKSPMKSAPPPPCRDVDITHRPPFGVQRRPLAVRPFLVRWLVVLGCSLAGFTGLAHELRPAYLELKEVEAETYEVLWKVPARGHIE
jgi:hypothetical protein